MSTFSSSSSFFCCTGIQFWQRNDNQPEQKQILMLKKSRKKINKSPYFNGQMAGLGKVENAITGDLPTIILGVSLAGIKIKSKRWSFVSWFFTQRLLFHVTKMLTKENNGKDCLIFYQHKMCSIVLTEAICFQGWRSEVIKQPIFVTWLYFRPSHVT